MSRSIGHSTLTGLIDDSDSEDTQFVETMPTPDSAAENRARGKKARGKPKIAPSKVTKTKAPARRLSGRLLAKAKTAEVAPTKAKRKALADKTNHQETGEVDEFDTLMADELDATIIAVEEKKPKPRKEKTATGRVTKRTAPTKRAASVEKSLEVLESQVPEAEIEDTRGEEEIVKPVSRLVHASRLRERSHPRQPSLQRRRAGSTSDTERDPVLRRKLGEKTKQYDSLSVKYQDLREIGLKEAERNFERLNKQNAQEKAGKFWQA
jgi:hypothetical protein